MLVLFETPAGHALFKLLDDHALRDASSHDFEAETTIKAMVKLQAFNRFTDTTSALAAATAIVDGKPTKDLRKFLKKSVSAGEHIAVGDAKLGAAIKDKTGLQCVFSQAVSDLMRGIRGNLESLLGEGETDSDQSRKSMVLGLAHSLSRYKLKFSPDKVDTMIVQAISLLDELDKEINIYAMRLREWYGWHFPEMGKIITDNAAYAQTVTKMGMRSRAPELDFSDVLQVETEHELKQAAQISMGTEISEEDVANIRALCDQVTSLTQYRATLFEYLKNRMTAIAPNLTAMVGELVGARLIAHAGSLLSLAKYPASTVQILGAEKALFRALKTKHATPKYGLIYHASVVGQAAPKHKGKISRSLAAKCALSIRVDALGDTGDDCTVGEQGRIAIEARLNQLEGKTGLGISRLGPAEDKQKKYRPGNSAGKVLDGSGDMSLGTKDRTVRKQNTGDLEKDVAEPASDSEGEKIRSREDKEQSVRTNGTNSHDEEKPVVASSEAKEIKVKTKSSKSGEKKEKKKRRRNSDADVLADGSTEKKKKKKKKTK